MHDIHCEDANKINQAIQTPSTKTEIKHHTAHACLLFGNYAQPLSLDNDICFKFSDRSFI